MRLVAWDEFKTLPSGTVFQEYSLHDLGTLSVLGDMCGENDFNYAWLLPVALSGDVFGAKVSDPWVVADPSGFGRDAHYDHSKRAWLVWEAEDRARLAGWLLGDAFKGQNDDGVVYAVQDKFVHLVDGCG